MTAPEGARRGEARRTRAALAGAIAALLPALALRGFTVDDALISARYAASLARGAGYRFNAAGPVTDGVTPLGWAHLLSLFAGGGPLAALAAAKVIGVTSWTLAAALLAIAVDRAGTRPIRFASLLIVAASASLGAWSAAGMETGLVIALAAIAAAAPELDRPLAGAACAGLVAGLRPEALPLAVVLAITPLPRGAVTPRRSARLAIAVAPFIAVAATRGILFGRAFPLSAVAKPADAALGANYALACFLLTGPVAIVAPFAWLKLDGWARGLVLAVLAHFVAVALAGGDWMPLSRLVTPALPVAVLAAAHLAEKADARATAARLALALAGEIFQTVRVAPAAAGVGAARLAVIEALGPTLSGSKVIAAEDIGWLGAATDATIVDLAGVTDPAIAVLAGGHTSKRVSVHLLDERRVDTLVLLLREDEPLKEPWIESAFARGVELRIAYFPGIGDAFTPTAVSAIPHLRYVVLRRRAPVVAP